MNFVCNISKTEALDKRGITVALYVSTSEQLWSSAAPIVSPSEIKSDLPAYLLEKRARATTWMFLSVL